MHVPSITQTIFSKGSGSVAHSTAHVSLAPSRNRASTWYGTNSYAQHTHAGARAHPSCSIRNCNVVAESVGSSSGVKLAAVVSRFDVFDGRGPPAVALGKFDALHLGHYALAEQAAALGSPYLVSFSGMAEVFGWPASKPIVAPSDRSRVLDAWAQNWIPEGSKLIERVFPFQLVRPLSPEAFVMLLVDLGVKGVVAGSNYRFGFKAAGDAEMLCVLGRKYDLDVAIVELVHCGLSDKRVSSTRIRACLEEGNTKEVHSLLGRPHRCLAEVSAESAALLKEHGTIQIPRECFLNRLPAVGTYQVHLGGPRGIPVPGEVAILESTVQISGRPNSLEMLSLGTCHELFMEF